MGRERVGTSRCRGGPGIDGDGLPETDTALESKSDVLDSLHGRLLVDGDGPSAALDGGGSGAAVERKVAALAHENENLRVAIDSRAVIEQAKGALILRYGLDHEAAFAVLKRWSQDSNVKLHTIAERLVNWAGSNDPLPAQPDRAERLEKDLEGLFAADPTQEE
jgi:hypothetical protein